MNLFRRTIRRSSPLIRGIGIHTGEKCRVRLRPAASGTGIWFYRQDLARRPGINATPQFLTHANRGTDLRSGRAGIRTIEHLMAALYAAGITNLAVEVWGPELPQLDGCSRTWIRVLQACGIRECPGIQTPLVISRTHTLRFPGKSFRVLPSPGFTATYLFVGEPALRGTCSVVSRAQAASRLAACRTFCRLSEIPFLQDQGLIRGGDLRQAVVINDRPPSSVLESLKNTLGSKHPLLRSRKTLITTGRPARPNEPCRHKLLDLLGDLYVLGRPLQGTIIAQGTGHRENAELVKYLAAQEGAL